MDYLDQVKTTQGRILIGDVRLEERDEGVMLIFTPPRLADADSTEPNAANNHADAPKLEDLAFASIRPITQTARQIGPLFGESLRESIFDWQDAASVAFATAQIQDVVNGSKPPATLENNQDGTAVAKTTITERKTGKQFAIYAVSIPLSAGRKGQYCKHLPAMPWHRRFGGSGVDYALATIDETGEIDSLIITLLSFPKEISPANFSFILQAFCGLSKLEGSKIAGQQPREQSSFARPDALVAKMASLDENDIPALNRLVQTLASIHLQNVRIDVFRSTTDDDFLLFDTRLSYLWYKFAKNLGNVKIGYCQECGKAFSLAGHRGIDRRFCGQECKTRAKNQRAKASREKARSLYLDGRSIEEIASSVYPALSSHLGRKKVISDLCTWVELKHRAREPKKSNRELKQRLIDDEIFDKKFVNL